MVVTYYERRKKKGQEAPLGQKDKFLILLFNFCQKNWQAAEECYFLRKLKVTESQKHFFFISLLTKKPMKY